MLEADLTGESTSFTSGTESPGSNEDSKLNILKKNKLSRSGELAESNHKTCICTFWIRGLCKNGADQCRFAHGEEELKLPMSKTVTRRKNKRMNRAAKLSAEKGDIMFPSDDQFTNRYQRRLRRTGTEETDTLSDDLKEFLLLTKNKMSSSPSENAGRFDMTVGRDGFLPDHFLSALDDEEEKFRSAQEVDLTQMFLAVVLLQRRTTTFGTVPMQPLKSFSTSSSSLVLSGGSSGVVCH